MRRVCAFLAGLLLTVGTARADAPMLVSVPSPRGETTALILIRPEKPVASVILFAGGHGALGLRSPSAMNWGDGNFLVRTRNRFAAHGLMVAVVDAPSDQRRGMSVIFRMSRAHAQDIEAVAAYLKTQADVPVWLVGTSMGTFSAAAGAIGSKGVDGLVLTSTITRADPQWQIANSHRDGVASMALETISVPTLVVSHEKDGCGITPPGDYPKLSRRLTAALKIENILLAGGDLPRSTPCEAYAEHGFFGIEQRAVDTIATFIKANGR